MNKIGQSGRASASEWYENLKHEARAILILFYGIDEPTEKEICLYILYGGKAFENRRKAR